jgi:hypothetical protein
MSFVTITKSEFESGLADALRASAHKFNLNNLKLHAAKRKGNQEVVYWIYTGHGSVWIKVFSSISPVTCVSDEIGADAIRFVLIDSITDRPVVEKQTHMKRIDTWRKNLTKRVEALICEQCNSIKVERNGPSGKFMGCLNFRNHAPRKAAV